MWKGILILSHFLWTSNCQLNTSAIDSILTINSGVLLSDESSVLKAFTSCNASLTFSCLNLKSINLASNLTTAMTILMTTLREFQSMKNFESFLNFTEPSTCDYFVYRMTALEFEMENYQRILFDIEANATSLYELGRDVYFYYCVYYRKLQMNWTRAQSVVNVLKSFWNIFKEFADFTGLIKANLKYSAQLYDFVNQTYTTSNCSTNFTCEIKPKGDLIEDDLIKAQSELIELENVALQKVQSALVVTANDSSTKMTLIDLEYTFKKQKTVDDYYKLKWPRIPDTRNKNDNGFYFKVKTSTSRMAHYNFVTNRVKSNQTKVQTLYNTLSKSVASISSTRKVRAASPQVNDVLIATSSVLNKFNDYSSRMANAIFQVNKLIKASPSPCASIMNITDSKGKYLKSACMMKTVVYYLAAQLLCQDNNMPSLYAITSADEYAGLITFSQQFSMAEFGTHLWKHYEISGVQRSDGRWFNRNVLMTPLAIPAVPGFCLFISGTTGVPLFTAYSCAKTSHIICEYDKNTQTPAGGDRHLDITTGASAYIKTAAILLITTNPIANHQNCKNSGFKGAYTVTSADDAAGIKNYIQTMMPVGWYQIGGMQATNYSWYYPDGQNFYLGKPEAYETGCLVIEGYPSGFATTAFPCSDANWFICEFKY